MTEPDSPLRSRFSGPAGLLRIALSLELVSIYFSLSMLPTAQKSAVSLALALAGVVMAIRVRATKKTEVTKGRLISTLLVGLTAAIIGSLSLSAGLLLQKEISRYQDCMSGAITHASTSICQTQLKDDLNARIAKLRP